MPLPCDFEFVYELLVPFDTHWYGGETGECGSGRKRRGVLGLKSYNVFTRFDVVRACVASYTDHSRGGQKKVSTPHGAEMVLNRDNKRNMYEVEPIVIAKTHKVKRALAVL